MKYKEYGHGTCMADIAIGKNNGVAKDDEVTSVTMNSYDYGFLSRLGRESLIDGLSQAINDMYSKGLSNRAVVLMAFVMHTGPSPYEEAFRYAFWTLLKRFQDYGVAIVVAAPNKAECSPFHTPCIFANEQYNKDLPYGPPLTTVIAVGNADVDSGKYIGQPGEYSDWLTIFGPGQDDRAGGIRCIGPIGNNIRVNPFGYPDGGTSQASAAIAGLMAYNLDRLGVAQDARNHLIGYSYKRADDGPKMPYNEQ